MDSQLLSLRNEIDQCDDQILQLINRRVHLAQRVGEVKKQANALSPVVYRPEREAQILRRLISQNKGPLNDESICKFFREVISLCRSKEAVISVAVLGPCGTYTELAAKKQFGQNVDILYEPSIDAVFNAVANGVVMYGVVPITNSEHGGVSDTVSSLIKHQVSVIGEVSLKIDHCLASQTGKMEDIRSIKAKSQALAQSQNWLNKNLPDAHHIDANSTAHGAQIAMQNPDVAVVIPATTAPIYSLKVISESIQNKSDNRTRFFVFSADQKVNPSGIDQTSLLLTTEDTQIEQSLQEMGCVFFATDSQSHKTAFLVDIPGHEQDVRVQETLQQLQIRKIDFKILGSYPQAVA